MEHHMQMQSMQKLNSERLKALAKAEPDISVLWLYGSRARGTYSAPSDYDLAVAFDSFLSDALETRLRPELLAL
jgi:predicted nucleotidyltransferase